MLYIDKSMLIQMLLTYRSSRGRCCSKRTISDRVGTANVIIICVTAGSVYNDFRKVFGICMVRRC